MQILNRPSHQIECCICGNSIELTDADGYSLLVQKFGDDSPGWIWAHGPCLLRVAPVVGIEIPPGDSRKRPQQRFHKWLNWLRK